MRIPNAAIGLFLFALSTSCTAVHDQAANVGDPLPGTGNYVLRVDRVANHPTVESPSDAIPEDQFAPNDSGKSHSVVVSSDGNSVSIDGGQMIGARRSANNGQTMFELTQGVFAGGRFVATSKESAVEGELTIYGSGVPIISSERGTLVPSAASD